MNEEAMPMLLDVSVFTGAGAHDGAVAIGEVQTPNCSNLILITQAS